MAETNIVGNCPHCQKQVAQRVYYTVPEEVNERFYRSVWKHVSVLILTGFLFVWGLVLMGKEYDILKLSKLLEHPSVQVEDTVYGDLRKDVNADVFKVTKVAQDSAFKNHEEVKRLSDVNIKLQKMVDDFKVEVDQLRDVSAADRKRLRELQVQMEGLMGKKEGR